MMELPSIFVQEMQQLWGDEYPAFAAALALEPWVSVRLNPYKGNGQAAFSQDSGFAIRCDPVAWCRNGYYLESRPSFTADPLFHAGCYYVQEASSMFVEQLVRQRVTEPVVCLDLCAAPGGKSTHLSAILPQGSLLVANEVIRSRAYVLAENLIKWGNPATIVTQNDPADIGRLKHQFDVIMADVPCSGEGMFRKDPQAIQEWSPANVKLCAARQQRIIADIWPALKPGGILIYSTCTFNTHEDEENIRWMMDTFGAEPLAIDCPPEWGIVGSANATIHVSRFLPHRTKGEGFFLAALRKPAENDAETRHISSSQNKANKEQNKQAMQKDTAHRLFLQQVAHWIKCPEQYVIQATDTGIIAIPQEHNETYRFLSNKLRILSAGIALGEVKGKDLIPHHALAMSMALNEEAFPSYEIDKLTAIQYLSKEAIHVFPPEFPKSYVLLTYKHHPLGFVKNIGNRANNMYPQEWRIRQKAFTQCCQ